MTRRIAVSSVARKRIGTLRPESTLIPAWGVWATTVPSIRVRSTRRGNGIEGPFRTTLTRVLPFYAEQALPCTPFVKRRRGDCPFLMWSVS